MMRLKRERFDFGVPNSGFYKLLSGQQTGGGTKYPITYNRRRRGM